jgi:hypothetical protein
MFRSEISLGNLERLARALLGSGVSRKDYVEKGEVVLAAYRFSTSLLTICFAGRFADIRDTPEGRSRLAISTLQAQELAQLVGGRM